VLLSNRGKLYAYTISHYPTSGITPPYAIGFVDLPEGVRVFSVLKDWEGRLKADIDVALVVERLKENEEGDEVWTYKFRVDE